MTKVSFKLDEKRIKDAIARKAGARIRHIVTDLHQEILDRTAYNTGRTLGSWAGSAGQPMLIDVADRFGREVFAWSPGEVTPTNMVAVGREGGEREFYERFSLQSTQSIQFERNPYQIFFISNGARLDSGYDFAEGIRSDLPQGPGSRAAMQEFGVIASFDLFASTATRKAYNFEPRATNAVSMAVEKIRLRYGKL